jgi:hypothetical protein
MRFREAEILDLGTANQMCGIEGGCSIDDNAEWVVVAAMAAAGCSDRKPDRHARFSNENARNRRNTLMVEMGGSDEVDATI